jgi:hypothetical protein
MVLKKQNICVLSVTVTEDMSWVKLYGRCSRIMYRGPCGPAPSACPSLFKQTLTDLLALTNITKISIDKFFPPAMSFAPFVAVMTYTATISPIVFIYMKYIEYYPDTRISLSDTISLNNLKDLYLQYNMDWQNDPTLGTAIANGIM